MSENIKDMCEYYSSTVKSGIEYSEDDKQKLENMRKLKENIELYSTTEEDVEEYEDYNGYEHDDFYTCPYCQALHDSQYELEKCIEECQ